MKKITLLLFLYLLQITFIHAQTPPNAFNYSAVARNAAGQPIANSTIGIQISILKTSTVGTTVYRENHAVNTDAFGLFNLVIGAGSIQTGSMATINWGNDNYYLKVGMDATGGTNFLTMGTTQLLSVPYALYAKSAGTVTNSNDNDTSATNELQVISLKNDTIFLTNGGFVKLPKVNDTSATNELQALSIKNDTIFISNGGFVKLPTKITINSVSSSGDTLSLSNGQIFKATAKGAFTHYIGEEFGGGVIFHLWKDNAGVEHGLIVDKTDLSTAQAWSNIDQTLIGPAALSIWDGLSNSNAVIGQAGHTSSAAALCLNSTNGGQNDWYLPSVQELNMLWNNYYTVARSLTQISGATQLQPTYYWSSTESAYGSAWSFLFFFGYANHGLKDATRYVRAVRAF
jgi:hypothetical protein